MQQRQLRLGDILDDYCPRERRLTNHAVVAMVGEAVKQTRCTTCDSEHEYKHAKIPRQRRKNDAPAALYTQVAAGAPKRIAHEHPVDDPDLESTVSETEDITPDTEPIESIVHVSSSAEPEEVPPTHQVTAAAPAEDDAGDADSPDEKDESEGPIHRRLIRASLPRPEGQQPPARPIPEFTIRQPNGRQNRFRPRNARGGHGQHGHQFGGNRNGNMGGNMRGGGRPGGGMMNRRGQGGGGRKRSK